MTRVSDRAEFAAAVAEGGALPFLALALMRAPQADALLARTSELLGGRPWGVGVLGFVPAELRAEQLEVVRAHRPPFALIAGGRPDQARELEADGITTYLHVPSPGLLKLYLAQGARRFVFEGRECGGHVGPRTSFVLWDTMMRVLLEELPREDSDCHVLFAGGIHDARSAAMVAASRGRSQRARSPRRRPARDGLPVHARGHRGRSDHAPVPGGGDRGQRHGPARERSGPRHPLPGLALRRALRERPPRPAGRGGRRRGAARPPRGAEHRPSADRGEGGRSGLRRLRGAGRRARRGSPLGPVGAGHVHDRAGRGDAQRGDERRRPAPRPRRWEQRAARHPPGTRPRARATGAAAGGHRDHRPWLHPPRGSRREHLLGEHPRRGGRHHRDPPGALGLAPYVRRRPGGPRQGQLTLGRVHRSGPARADGARLAAAVAGIDRALPAARAAVRPVRARRRRLRDTSVRPGTHVGDPRGRRRRGGHGGRLHGPFGDPVAARRRPARAPGGDLRPPPRVDRGQLRRPADERGRRTDRQPARLRRYQLHGRRGVCLLPECDRPGRPRAADRDQRHGARRRGRRDPEPVRLPLLRQDPRPLPLRALPPVRRRRRRDRDQRGLRDAWCSSGSPTPSATATASTP